MNNQDLALAIQKTVINSTDFKKLVKESIGSNGRGGDCLNVENTWEAIKLKWEETQSEMGTMKKRIQCIENKVTNDEEVRGEETGRLGIYRSRGG